MPCVQPRSLAAASATVAEVATPTSVAMLMSFWLIVGERRSAGSGNTRTVAVAW